MRFGLKWRSNRCIRITVSKRFFRRGLPYRCEVLIGFLCLSNSEAQRHQNTSTHHATCCETDSTLPSGSLNQATLSPVGAVHIPSASCSKKPKRSKWTPFSCSSAATFSMFLTCQPRMVNCAGVECGPAHPHHNSIRVKNHREAVIFYKAKPQDVHVKGSRLLSIFGGNESD